MATDPFLSSCVVDPPYSLRERLLLFGFLVGGILFAAFLLTLLITL